METALPNLHPALVHFPIALIPVALGLDLVWLGTGNSSAARFSAVAWCLAALSAGATFVAGRVAADGLLDVPPLVQPRIADHANWALATVTLTTAVFLVRLFAEWRRTAGWSTSARRFGILLGIALALVLFVTADKGGALVYQHGLAVTVPSCPSCDSPPPAASDVARGELLRDEGGQLVWAPAAGDAGVLNAEAWPSRGMAIRIAGSQTTLFKPSVGDVQLNVWLDLSAFVGEAWLLHHLDGDQGGAFAVSTTGVARLVDLRPEPVDLDSAQIAWSGQHALAVNVAGSHLKGMVDGKLVVHGHTTAQPPGKIALRFVGDGVVAIERLEIVALGAGSGE